MPSVPERAVLLKRWLAGRTGRRVLIGLVLAAPFAIILGPLLGDVLYALFPWPMRKAAGRIVFFAILVLGLRRLLQVRPGEAGGRRADGPLPPHRGDRLAACFLAIAVGSLAFPLLRHPDNLGFGDWDYPLQQTEAMRRTILDHHQFPWWNPWCRGGFPLAAEPVNGVISLTMPFVLFLGTRIGVRLGALVCLWVGAEGARRLGRLWMTDSWSAAAVGFLYALNGGMAVYLVAGNYIPTSFCSLPWMLLFAFRLGGSDRVAPGVGLGLATALNLLNGINYPSVYALVVTGLVWLRTGRLAWPEQRRRFLVQTGLALGTCLSLSGWRLIPTWLVMRDFPRHHASGVNLSLEYLWVCLTSRPDPASLRHTAIPVFWESNSYIGVAGVILFNVSLLRGWRWWHTLALCCFWLSLGAVTWYHPSYWLSEWPVFASMHMVTRWRIVALLGVSLAVGETLAHLRSHHARWVRLLVLGLMLVLAADHLVYAHRIVGIAASIEPIEARFPGPETRELINVEYGKENHVFPAVLRGYGVIRAQEPLLGYDLRRPTARLWKGHPDYRGEAWTETGPVRPRVWSPNQIIFQVRPGETVRLNQNPGSWWWINGQPGFPTYRCAEWGKPFEAVADSRGRLVLEIHPRGLLLGLGLQGLGLMLLLASCLPAWRCRPASASNARTAL